MPQPAGYSEFLARSRAINRLPRGLGGNENNRLTASMASNRMGTYRLRPSAQELDTRSPRSTVASRSTSGGAGRNYRPPSPPASAGQPPRAANNLDTPGDLDFFLHFTQQRADGPAVRETSYGEEILTVKDLVRELLCASPEAVVNKLCAFAQPKLPYEKAFVEETLDQLERQFARYGSSFVDARIRLGLRRRESSGSGSVPHAGASTTARANASSRPVRSTRPAVVRSDTADADLPAYAPDDPEPESTLLLNQRLAAEAQAEGESQNAALAVEAEAVPSEAPPAYERRRSDGSIVSPVQASPPLLAPPREIRRRKSFGALVARIVSR